MERNFDAVLFDFDGTVADTGEGILKSLQFAFADQGRQVPDLADLRKFIGPPIYYSFTTYYGVSEQEVEAYIRSYRKRYREKGVFECAVYPGMRELLAALRERGVKTGVASSKPTTLIHAVMAHLGLSDLFDAVVGTAFDDSRHTSKADLVAQSRMLLGVEDPKRALMVGDRLYDIDGAHGAGSPGCGVLFGYGSLEEFEAHGADYIVETPDEILALVFPKESRQGS